MKCVDCPGQLKQVDYNSIKIEECSSCRGIWFDRGELDKAKDQTDEDLRWLDFDPFGDEANQFLVDSKNRACPRCSANMDSLSYEKSKVIINKCLVCYGIWVPQGQFKKIVKYLEDIITSESSSEYVKDSLKHFLEIFSGKDDIRSEVKDFLVVLKLLKMRVVAEHPELEEAAKRIFQYLPFL